MARNHLAVSRPLAYVVILTALVSPGRADDRRADKNRLVVMTLNAEFLWDGVDPEEGNPSVSFPWKGSATEAHEHMEDVAAIVMRADPDILNLCEVENQAALDLFNDTFLTGRGYRAYLAQGADSFTGQDVALLTRIDPVDGAIHYDGRKGHSGGQAKAMSKDYVARFDVGGVKIALVGLHLLAQPNREDRRLPRQAQADAARLIALDQVAEGYGVVVLGDVNDYDGDDCCRDHIDSTPITTVLTAIKGMDPADAGDDLVSAASFVPKANRYTAHWDKNDNGAVDPPQELTAIDHLLLSPTLANRIEYVDIPHTHDPTQHPDHFPIVVRLKLAGDDGPVPVGESVRLVELAPNPPGNENQNEQATIKNIGASPVNLANWKLRDLAGKTWSLDSAGTLAAGQEKVVKRLGQPMAMNNGGDTIDLVNPTNAVVQSVTYGHVDEGEVVSVEP